MIVHDGMKIKGSVDTSVAFKWRGDAAKDGVIGWSETQSNLEMISKVPQRLKKVQLSQQ